MQEITGGSDVDVGRCESILGPGGDGCLVDHLDPPMRRLAYRGLALTNAPPGPNASNGPVHNIMDRPEALCSSTWALVAAV